tara:strand:- start:8928 stop:9215 length:288 start_codon:yes stop_codon:yes gene_type:complete
MRLSSKKGTAKLVYAVSLLKERELRRYKQKVLELEKSIEKDSNNKLYDRKYSIVNIRYEQLIKNFKDLKQLEMELDKLNFNYFLGTLSFEVVLRI